MEREELIDKYLHSELTAAEQDQFDELLVNDISFKEDVDLLSNLKNVAGAEDRDDLRKQMANFEAKIAANDTKVIPLFSYKKLLVAASILLLVAVGVISLLNPFGVNTEKLYASNFEPYKNVVTPIVRGTTDDNEEITAFSSYENKEFIAAAEQFGKLYETTQKPYFLLYQANALLAADQTSEAIPLLEQHIALKDELIERGKWYLSLAYLKENQKEKAIQLLEDLSNNGTFKKGDVNKLLGQLK
ncbi:hypothetical protein [Aquimarina litoralis]|uniref:hypothetical protein n=1 Tax=Aquimarina litoralis TaxID=584605 RepID=UPI001C579008|nr:hypothetical protein [Aquimarina litoralis]MBW1296176.1 hypothetical protein [Aquimarina litoralis]